MSEAVGACILSGGNQVGAIGDAAEVEYFLEKIDAELYSNSLNNGCDFPTSSQVSQKVLLPFFMEKFSEHLLFGIFHSEEDGSWILEGRQCLKSSLYREDCLNVLILHDGCGKPNW